MSKILVTITLLFVITLSSCADKKIASVQAPCISEELNGTTITWGIIDNTTKVRYGYVLNTDAKIYYFTKSFDKEDYLETELVKLDNDKFCKIFHNTQYKLVKLQVLYTPGEIQKFIEYRCPKKDLTLRGVWNPQFLKNGSDKFSALYDSLLTLIPQSHKLKSKISKPVEIIKEEETKYVQPIK